MVLKIFMAEILISKYVLLISTTKYGDTKASAPNSSSLMYFNIPGKIGKEETCEIDFTNVGKAREI